MALTRDETNARRRRQRDLERGGPPRAFADIARQMHERRRQAEAAERGPLFRRMITEAVGDCGLDDLTVLGLLRDPYRLDTPANHALGQWFAVQVERLVPTGATVHLRGLHYRLVAVGDVVKPNGQLYRNTDPDYVWFGERAARAARWLGYVEFERIVDERNAEPEVYGRPSHPVIVPSSQVSLHSGLGLSTHGIGAEMREQLRFGAEGAMPTVSCYVSSAHQPYRIVFIGEKVSLKPVLQPIAQRVHGDLILPTGELSDTLLFGLAERAAEDGDSTVVLYFSDFDPAGYHMPVNVSRKLQALREVRFPDLDIAVYPVALTFEQVRDLDLPSTPLKDTEQRRDRWREHWGHEQTEIDALAALRPDALRDIAEQAVAPFWDPTLADRIRQAGWTWQAEAYRLLRAHPLYAETAAALGAILDEAEATIGTFETQWQEAADKLQAAQADSIEKLKVDLPPPYEPVELEMTAKAPEPLYSSRDDWREATEKLIAYRNLGEEPADC
jgi:hypothetical protein